MTRYASMLRGVNVSGHRRVSMGDLRALYADLGLDGVESYRQSGNVVFSSASRSAGRLAATIEDALRAAFDYDDVDVLVRGPGELDRLVAANPFLAAGADPATLHVTFLKDVPSGGPFADAVPGGGADGFAFAERAAYVHCPAGYGRTKLHNGYFERLTGVRATTRNWATVTALRDLTAPGRR
ncbi:MAG: DUF1697 domain-containing protein [Acidimicrobiales bacterium]